jgi:predicted nucleic acid-binding protein
LAAVVLVPPDVPKIVPHDPKDDPIVLTAIVGQAAVLCTLDKHLYAQPVVNFCGTHNIRILTDVTLLKELKSS